VRILLLSNLYPPFVEGGAEILAGDIAAGLERLGHEVIVLTSSYGLSKPQHDGKLWRSLQPAPPVYFDRQRTFWSQLNQPFNYYRRYHNAANARTLRQVVVATTPDILYIWEITGIGVNSLLKVLPDLNIPIVFHLGSYWLLYAHSPQTEQSRLRLRWLKQRLIGTVPELTWTSLIAVSATVKLEYVRSGFDPKRIEVIYNGIDPRFLTLPRSASNEEEAFQLLFVGRIRVEKGILVLLKALDLLLHEMNSPDLLSAKLSDGHNAGTSGMHEMNGSVLLSPVLSEANGAAKNLDSPPLHLHIFGDGDETYISELKTFLHEKGLTEIVTFHGKVPQDELIQHYDRCDLMLVPSLWQEPFGLVVAEAMARGLPVIASNVGGPAEILTHEINGLLVEAGNERALASAINQLIKDPEKRKRFGQTARSTVQQRFVIEENASRVEQHLQRALNNEILRYAQDDTIHSDV
jgi:glycosyltransferase involved in cell wall biosynthesis